MGSSLIDLIVALFDHMRPFVVSMFSLRCFLNQLGCEARPCCEEIGVDSLDPGLGDWVSHSLAEERGYVLLFDELVDIIYFRDFS